jgi:aryl sulfotransferase
MRDSSIGQREPSPDPAYAVLCEVRDAITRDLNAHLAAAGFGDVTEDDLLIVAATRLRDSSAPALVRRLGITRQAASQSMETLVLRGYLELRDNPDDSHQPTIIVTERGDAVLDAAEAGLRADRWAEFRHRPGDIVISSVPKSGTTWLQMICALLIFQTTDLPASLSELSPWLDAAAGVKRAKIHAQFAAQQHRRFVKTHTPLNELPINPRVTYIVVARNPLDTAVSFHYHLSELLTDHERPPATARQWMLSRIDEMGTSPRGRDSYFDALLKSLNGAWERRAEQNVVLVHYEDLSADLAGEMRRIAKRLNIAVPEVKFSGLVEAATFTQMRAVADQLKPLQYEREGGYAAFFRRGASGEGRSLLTSAEVNRYYARAVRLVPRELLAWLHRDMKLLLNLKHPPAARAYRCGAARTATLGALYLRHGRSNGPLPRR